MLIWWIWQRRYLLRHSGTRLFTPLLLGVPILFSVDVGYFLPIWICWGKSQLYPWDGISLGQYGDMQENKLHGANKNRKWAHTHPISTKPSVVQETVEKLFMHILFLMERFWLLSQCQLWFPALGGGLVKRHKAYLCRHSNSELGKRRMTPHLYSAVEPPILGGLQSPAQP